MRMLQKMVIAMKREFTKVESMKKVAVVGIQGVPAQYGGFESLVENLLVNKADNVMYTVFCSSKDMPQHMAEYKGARLRYVPLRANGFQSIPYDIISLMRIPKETDAILVLGVSGCIFLPLFRLFCRKRLIINIDGPEYRRAKWGRWTKMFLKLSERFAVRFADVVIADNKGIQDYVRQEYGRETELIAYGGDQVICDIDQKREEEILAGYGLHKGGYYISVCRIEPENNCHLILDTISKSGKELVYIGNWSKSAYGQELKDRYSCCPNIHLLDSIYDMDILYALRKNSRAYIHGHSVGGTNPSLVEAMFCGRPIFAYDVVYNRETTCGKAAYWSNPDELSELLAREPYDAPSLKETASAMYRWQMIARQYENLY